MTAEKARTIVGVDLHSVKVQLYISQWQGCHELPGSGKSILTTREALFATYENNVPKDSTSVIEVSTGVFTIARKLRSLGYGVKVVKSDTITHFERKDHINDEIDAKNLAEAEAIGYVEKKKKVVHVPSELYQDYRALESQYQNAIIACSMASNQIWSLCSAYDEPLPPRGKIQKVETLRALIEKSSLSPTRKTILEDELWAYEKAYERKENLERKILEIVSHNEDMLKIMQITGIAQITAFSLMAHVEDIRRFETAKKLVAYVGLNPVENRSGNGKSPNRLSSFGIKRVKSLLVEGAHSAMSKGNGSMHDWARRKVMQGKHRNVILCALARKMLVYVWHILKGHPIPDRTGEESYALKLRKLVSRTGKKKLNKKDYAQRQKICSDIMEKLFADVPPLTEEQTKAIKKRKEKTKRQVAELKKQREDRSSR